MLINWVETAWQSLNDECIVNGFMHFFDKQKELNNYVLSNEESFHLYIDSDQTKYLLTSVDEDDEYIRVEAKDDNNQRRHRQVDRLDLSIYKTKITSYNIIVIVINIYSIINSNFEILNKNHNTII